MRSIVHSGRFGGGDVRARIAGDPAVAPTPAANKRRDNIIASSACLIIGMKISMTARANAGKEGRADASQQASPRIPSRRYELRMVDPGRLSRRDRTEDPGGCS